MSTFLFVMQTLCHGAGIESASRDIAILRDWRVTAQPPDEWASWLCRSR